MDPLVSVLIPAYNSEKYLAQSITSALQQTWKRVEVIVVDDGSHDKTVEVAKSFSSANVRILSQENQGAAAARNTAYSLAQGDYIQWLDADDILAPEKVERQLTALGNNKEERILLSGAWAHFIFRTSQARFRPSPLWESMSPAEWLTRKLESGSHMQTATWLVSRAICELAGPWDTRFHRDDDGEYFCRVIQASKEIRFVERSCVYYRIVGAGSLSYVGTSDAKLEAQLLSCRLHIKACLDMDDSGRSRRACVKYLQRFIPLFYECRSDIVAQMREMASELDGTLQDPELPVKYRWLCWAVGWTNANAVIRWYNRIKFQVIRTLDWCAYHLQSKRPSL